MSGISADDPDKGLNIRFDPTTASGIQFALPNGTRVSATGMCEISADGAIWWEVENGLWTGWANSQFLTGYSAGSSACNAGVYDPVGKGTVETILGDFDGDGLVDAMNLSFDGVVQAPNTWTGSKATLQIQFADGGLSGELDITALIGDGGPAIGNIFGGQFGEPFSERIDFAGSSLSAAVFSSTYAGSATGAGRTHFAFASHCEPVMGSIETNPSAGNPLAPVLCASGNAGRMDLYSLDGLNSTSQFVVTPYLQIADQLIPQPEITAGDLNSGFTLC